MAGEVIVLGTGYSMFSMRVTVALSEKGVDYEFREEDLRDKSPLLLESNPAYKKIPVLIHNGKPICESLTIVEYIDEVWKDKSPLLTSDPYQRAQARFWADFVDQKVRPLGDKIVSMKGDEQEAGKKEYIEALKLLEGQLGDKPYFGGDHLGFLDVAFVSYYVWLKALEPFEIIGKFDVEEYCPKLAVWGKRCMERESVSKSMPDPKSVNELVMIIKKRLDVD